MTTNKQHNASTDPGDRSSKLRTNLEYIAAYLESAVEVEQESGLLMSAEFLLSDVLEFLARDNAERTNSELMRYARPEGPPPNGSMPWWCSECAEWVHSYDVTYFETHDERTGGCGNKCE